MVYIHAQQALGEGSDITSPEVHSNNTVTFRLYAPNANTVEITGDWIPRDNWKPGMVSLTKDAKGFGLTRQKLYLLIFIAIHSL